ERPGDLLGIVSVEENQLAAQTHAVERIDPRARRMDQLALRASDVGIESHGGIDRPAPWRLGPDESRDRLGAAAPGDRPPLQLLVEPSGLARLFHGYETLTDLLEEVAFDDRKHCAVLAVVARAGRRRRQQDEQRKKNERPHRIALPLPNICRSQTKPIAP